MDIVLVRRMDDQLPLGVKTSTTSRRSAGNDGATMWLIWRAAFPAPRISTATPSGVISFGASRLVARAAQTASSSGVSAVTAITLSRGR